MKFFTFLLLLFTSLFTILPTFAIPLTDLAYWAKGTKVATAGKLRAWICKDSVSGKPLNVNL